MQGSRILIVDADRAGREALITCFKFAGLDAFGVAKAGEADDWLARSHVDVVVLSEDLADDTTQRITGPSIFRLPRRPVSMSQVVERVESLIQQRQQASHGPLIFADLRVHESEGTASRSGVVIRLGGIEVKLLAFLVKSPDKVFSREHLLRRVWPSYAVVEPRTVDVAIGRLRRALRPLAVAHWIQTVRRSGYRFSVIT